MCSSVCVISIDNYCCEEKKNIMQQLLSRTMSGSRSTPSIYGHVHIVQRRPVSINTKNSNAYTPKTVQSQIQSVTSNSKKYYYVMTLAFKN